VSALIALVLALDGESANQGNTALAVVSVVSMVFGYVLLACLWHFVFSAKARRRRGEKDPPP
jgi:heme/copper-type cytochrome/quinol oxidase subunit 2